LAMPQLSGLTKKRAENRISTYYPPVIKNSIGISLKLVYPGRFTMGSPTVGNAIPHEVRLTKPFYMGVVEVTQEQYSIVMGNNPSKTIGANLPVEQISWPDATEFCRQLSALPKERAAGRTYRLPTESEWERACRAGTTTEYSFGEAANNLLDYAWFLNNSENRTHPVGQKKPNPWELYDMHGNVWEWCQDWEGDYPNGDVTDPLGPQEGTRRILRGGGCINDAFYCRSAGRRADNPTVRYGDHGFRVVLIQSSPAGIN